MHRILPLVMLLFGCWYVFSGYNQPFFLAAGFISSILALILSRQLYNADEPHLAHISLLRSAAYALWLLREMLLSALDVSKRVWQVKPELSPTISWVPSTQSTPLTQVIYGTSITLTPGTVCIDIQEGKMLVHSLTESGITALQQQHMDKRITALEKRLA